MAKSKTTQRTSLSSWQEVDEKLRIIGEMDTVIASSEAKMNKRILAIQQEHEESTREARERKIAAEKEIELYCKEHRDEFTTSKTKTLNFGLLSFRMSTPKLSTLRGFTYETVLKLFKKLGMTEYIRVKEEIDKDMVKAQITDPKDLAAVGLAVTQSEQFYYETFKRDLVPTD